MKNFEFDYGYTEGFIGGKELDEHGFLFEPQWELNPELKSAVFEGMPETLSPENKVMFIYFRLCKLLRYDDGYMYNDRMSEAEREKYTSKFCKERIENVKPESVITCYDFGRIFCKFANEVGKGKIVPMYKFHGVNRGHASIGFYTKRVCVQLEPILLYEKKQSNDLLNIKIGAMPDGINIVADQNNEIRDSLFDVYRLAVGESPITLKEKLAILNEQSTSKKSDSISLEEKLNAFSKTVRSTGIIGNEAVQLLINYNKAGFFGEKLKIALCAEQQKRKDKSIKFARKALIRSGNNDNPDELKSPYTYFLMDTKSMDITQVQPEQLSQDFISELYTFETQKQKDKMPELFNRGK